MRRFLKILASVCTALVAFNVMADDTSTSGRAVNEGSQASGHASGSAAYSIVASGQATSAVMAVPLAIGGSAVESAGATSTAAARDSMRAATTPIGTPLPITDETVTVVPPNEALKKRPPKGDAI